MFDGRVCSGGLAKKAEKATKKEEDETKQVRKRGEESLGCEWRMFQEDGRRGGFNLGIVISLENVNGVKAVRGKSLG